MNTKIKDDDFMILKRDIDKIAYRPLMYISSIGPRGVFHLCKEIIDNANDECYKKDSPGDTIEITIDDKMLTCRDNGRGIPTNLLKEVFETLQAGSNMTRSSGSTKGENGAGSACVLAMSKYLLWNRHLVGQKKEEYCRIYYNKFYKVFSSSNRTIKHIWIILSRYSNHWIIFSSSSILYNIII